MKIEKYNGCGNDFVILPFKENENYSQLAEKLCQDPKFDTDGLIAVKENPLEMVFYNRDGTRAPMCGNGIRCFSYYCLRHDIEKRLTFPVETLAGTLEIQVQQQEPFYCEVMMGQGHYSKEKVGFTSSQSLVNYEIPLSDGNLTATSLFMGTIHTVVFVESVAKELTLSHGEEICNHPFFKEKTNVNFVQINSDYSLTVRTFERGVGWTLACGTGCCASYVVAKDQGLIPKGKTIVHLPLGDLKVSGTTDIYMAGPALFEKEENVIC